jgi:hypothetical protein
MPAQGVDVRVADTAVVNRDANVVGQNLATFDGHRNERLALGTRSNGANNV